MARIEPVGAPYPPEVAERLDATSARISSPERDDDRTNAGIAGAR